MLPIPVGLRSVAEPYVLLGDISIIGFCFIGGIVFFARQERTISVIVSTPLRFREYLVAKLTALVLISLLGTLVMLLTVTLLAGHHDVG